MFGPLLESEMSSFEKVHAVVARSRFRSQNVQNTPCSDHFWSLRCRVLKKRTGIVGCRCATGDRNRRLPLCWRAPSCRQKKTHNHLSVNQWLRSAIFAPQQHSSPIGFLFLKLPPPPCAVLLVPAIDVGFGDFLLMWVSHIMTYSSWTKTIGRRSQTPGPHPSVASISGLLKICAIHVNPNIEIIDSPSILGKILRFTTTYWDYWKY